MKVLEKIEKPKIGDKFQEHFIIFIILSISSTITFTTLK